jgi:hypothetical protein
MASSSGVVVRGLRELEILAAATGKTATKALNAELRLVAEPIRADAETFAASGIRRIGPRWSKMRVGVTRKLVYVAPRQRGLKARGRDPRARPKFADLMEQRAMEPALRKNEANIEASIETLFEKISHDWNRV